MPEPKNEKQEATEVALPAVEVLEPLDVPALDALMDELTANMKPLEDPAALAPPLPDLSDGVESLPDLASMVEPLKEWPAPEVLPKHSD